MDNLHRKGWLTKERRGKLLYFAPTMTRAEYSAQLMRDAMCAGGDSGLVLAHFVESISDQQSRHLHDLIQDQPRTGTARALPSACCFITSPCWPSPRICSLATANTAAPGCRRCLAGHCRQCSARVGHRARIPDRQPARWAPHPTHECLFYCASPGRARQRLAASEDRHCRDRRGGSSSGSPGSCRGDQTGPNPAPVTIADRHACPTCTPGRSARRRHRRRNLRCSRAAGVLRHQAPCDRRHHRRPARSSASSSWRRSLHERAHLRRHHHLIVTTTRALATALPRIPLFPPRSCRDRPPHWK